MTATEFYRHLIEPLAQRQREEFDTQALACVLAVSLEESLQTGATLNATIGLSAAQIHALIFDRFAGNFVIDSVSIAPEVEVRAEEEENIRQLLLRSSTRSSPLAPVLASIIARRAMRPNHLWQDLGLTNRAMLSHLLQTHFEPLARRNHQGMKWKKFFYRMVCSEEGFTLCAAPVCSECSDFDVCFGDESGHSLLARNVWISSQSSSMPATGATEPTKPM